jgi:hypothetical protein
MTKPARSAGGTEAAVSLQDIPAQLIAPDRLARDLALLRPRLYRFAAHAQAGHRVLASLPPIVGRCRIPALRLDLAGRAAGRTAS